MLAYPTPAYAHLPVATNGAGEKLSKQTLARSVEGARPAQVLVDALDFLGQGPPPGLADCGLDEVWQWALRNWSMTRVPARRQAPCPAYA